MRIILSLAVMLTLIARSATAQTPITPTSASTLASATALAPDTVQRTPVSKPRAGTKTIVLDREVFQYTAITRRDPFVSLLTTSDLRPLISDLRLTTIAYDPNGVKSVAILRDLESKQQYRVARGAQLGRMRVSRIDQRSITFIIEEYGFSRQETLTLADSSTSATR